MNKIYILHGWTYSLDKWREAEDLLKKHGFNPVFLKVPGLTDKSQKVWTIDMYTAWLDDELKNESGPITLVGHSNGGRIALNYVVSNPDKVKRLVLIDSAGVYHNNFSIRVKRKVFKVVSKLGKPLKEVPILRKVLYKLARESDYRDAPLNMRRTMANMIESDKQLDVTKVTTKTVIIWGQQDTVTPVSDAKILNSAIQNSTLHLIDSARHAPHFTHSKELVNILKDELT
jgi:pimeloyl-ACP methyl ester carboxylesterase